jgi:type VI secretion system protein ImpE
MEALAAFNQGRLDESVNLALAQVRARPADAGARYVLAELLCFRGEFERADTQLETAEASDPEITLAVGQFRQLLRAELARQDFHQSGAVPAFLFDLTDDLRDRLEAAVLLRANRLQDAARKLAQAQAATPPASGWCDLARCDELRDADDLLSHVLEVLMADGRYCWVPFARVAAIRFEKPKRARDLLFRQAQLELHGSPGGEVFIPALYAGSFRSAQDDLRLGRATDWSGAPGEVVRGLGQRVWLTGESDKGLLEIQRIEFDPPSPAPAASHGG